MLHLSYRDVCLFIDKSRCVYLSATIYQCEWNFSQHVNEHNRNWVAMLCIDWTKERVCFMLCIWRMAEQRKQCLSRGQTRIHSYTPSMWDLLIHFFLFTFYLFRLFLLRFCVFWSLSNIPFFCLRVLSLFILLFYIEFYPNISFFVIHFFSASHCGMGWQMFRVRNELSDSIFYLLMLCSLSQSKCVLCIGLQTLYRLSSHIRLYIMMKSIKVSDFF